MIIGNLVVEKTAKGLIHIGLHTPNFDSDGVPFTLFTLNELDKLIGVLRDAQGSPAKAPVKPKKKITVVVSEDDFDVSDYV